MRTGENISPGNEGVEEETNLSTLRLLQQLGVGRGEGII